MRTRPVAGQQQRGRVDVRCAGIRGPGHLHAHGRRVDRQVRALAQARHPSRMPAAPQPAGAGAGANVGHQGRVVERGDPGDPVAAQGQHHDAVGLVAAVPARCVHDGGGLAVGPGGHQPPLAGTAQHPGPEEPDHRGPPAEPGRDRRHLQLDVGAQHAHQRVRVGAGEGVDVGVEEGPRRLPVRLGQVVARPVRPRPGGRGRGAARCRRPPRWCPGSRRPRPCGTPARRAGSAPPAAGRAGPAARR